MDKDIKTFLQIQLEMQIILNKALYEKKIIDREMYDYASNKLLSKLKDR